MNIVLVNVWLDPQRGGGTAERTRHLALHLAKLGCKCTIIAMGSTPWRSEFERAGVEFLSVKFLGQRRPFPLINFVDLFFLFRKVDVVHVMGFWFLLGAACCVLARMSETPSVICPAGSLTKFGRDTMIKRLYYAIAGRWMLKTASSIIATTQQEKALILSDFPLGASSVFISPNGIGLPPVRSADARSWNGRVILFVGRLTAIKAPDVLLEAFIPIASVMPDTLLLLCGPDFGLQRQLQRRVAELDLEKRVFFTGFVDEAHRTALLSQASILVVPSNSEVMSMVALEAGAMGVPVILTDQCGFDEIAEIGGGLVTEADREALSDALMTMLSDDARLKAMGGRLRDFVLVRYAWQTVAAGLLEKFETLRASRR